MLREIRERRLLSRSKRTLRRFSDATISPLVGSLVVEDRSFMLAHPHGEAFHSLASGWQDLLSDAVAEPSRNKRRCSLVSESIGSS